MRRFGRELPDLHQGDGQQPESEKRQAAAKKKLAVLGQQRHVERFPRAMPGGIDDDPERHHCDRQGYQNGFDHGRRWVCDGYYRSTVRMTLPRLSRV